jgi:hypothetical protein
MNAACAAQREACTCLVLADGTVTGDGTAGAIRRALLRVLAVAALALAGLLVFGLLPGGRDAAAVTPGPLPLPVVPAVHYLHPHGPNRAALHQPGTAGG